MGLARRIENGHIAVASRAAILVHVGTNDVNNAIRNNNSLARELKCSGTSKRQFIQPLNIVDRYKHMVAIIRARNKHCKIVLSAILPRRTGVEQEDYCSVQVNKAVMDYCMDTDNVVFNPTYKWFKHCGRPVVHYYAKRDTLHLSDPGSERLAQAFRMALADANLSKESHCKKRKRKDSK